METEYTKTQKIFRILLGLMLVTTGLGHLTFACIAFQAQVPDWVPMDKDLVVILSGFLEIAYAVALILLGKYRIQVGWLTALLFIMVFPGNIAQWLNHRSAFGLDTDGRRFARLFLQPVLITWALWSTGAWRSGKAYASSFLKNSAV